MISAATKLLVGGVVGLAILVGTCRAQDATTVFLGGTGPIPYLQTVIDGISDSLQSAGVKLKVSSGEAKSRTVLLDEMKTSGSTILLYVTVSQAKDQRGKILAESFVNGKKVWEEEVRGSLVAVSAEGEVRGMLKSINGKLVKHVGDAGLPK